MLGFISPPTGDTGLNPIILVLLIICSVIIIGCIIWAIVLNRKNSKIQTTVITITDEDQASLDQNIVEDIETEENTEL